MRPPRARTVQVNGRACRVWEKGRGKRVGYLAGPFGAFGWTPFLERLAAQRRVIVPSLPGFPGASGHELLHDLCDWVAALEDLLEAAGLDGADLIASSVSGALALELAALSRRSVRRLVLIAPLGLCDEREPVADFWGIVPGKLEELASARPDALRALLEPAAGADPIETQVERTRAQEASARLLWPLCDTGIARRLRRVSAPTLLLWGALDRIVPASYAKRIADGISGPAQLRTIPGAGHVAELDAPDACADAILEFLATP